MRLAGSGASIGVWIGRGDLARSLVYLDGFAHPVLHGAIERADGAANRRGLDAPGSGTTLIGSDWLPSGVTKCQE
jgi:hypothetical protein